MWGHRIAGGMLAIMLGACAGTPAEAPAQTAAVSVPAPLALDNPFADEFGALAALAGTRWRGEPSEAEKAKGQPADISEWSWDLGGTVLVNRHVLENGTYGGVTYVQRTASTGSLDYVYVTSAGFRTTGSFTLNDDGSWTSLEMVDGLSDIKAVRATGRIGEDGTLTSVSEFETEEGWVPGHTFVYRSTDIPLPELVPGLDVE